ncbi:hypothetical protein AB0D38_08995 [Streptomyces sp. NPDC048279]|uniref:hypothetical protein n=1 Tax=Streptomyces sp. NPDC048279 TaxID=3154714 RepID=UPI003434263F
MDSLGVTSVWMDGVASGKITDFAGEADVADAWEPRDFTPVRRGALIACLAHKARMRVRDNLATMFCKRIATKIKKAKAEPEEIRIEFQVPLPARVQPKQTPAGKRARARRSGGYPNTAKSGANMSRATNSTCTNVRIYWTSRRWRSSTSTPSAIRIISCG